MILHRRRVAAGIVLTVLLAACGTTPTGPTDPPASPGTPDPRFEILERLLNDPISVVGVSSLLNDPIGAAAVRSDAAALARDLDGRNLSGFTTDLAELERTTRALRAASKFDPRDGVILDAIDLYIAQSRAALDERFHTIPILTRG